MPAHRSNSALVVQVVGVLAALGVAIGLLLAEGVIYNTPSEMPTPTQIQEEERALLLWLDRAPASRFLLHVLGAAAEFERALIRERTQAGRARYEQDFLAGRVGKEVHSRSGRNLPPHRPRKIFDRERVAELRSQGLSLRQIARDLDLGLGTVTRTLRERSKSL